jgi:hypothetical protein
MLEDEIEDKIQLGKREKKKAKITRMRTKFDIKIK